MLAIAGNRTPSSGLNHVQYATITLQRKPDLSGTSSKGLHYCVSRIRAYSFEQIGAAGGFRPHDVLLGYGLKARWFQLLTYDCIKLVAYVGSAPTTLPLSRERSAK